MKNYKLGNVIVCEHIVQGLNNKHTLINIYSGDILLQEFPANLLLGFYTEFLPSDSGNASLELSISLGKKEVIRGEAEVKFEKGKPALLVLPATPFKIENACKMRVMVAVNGDKPICIVQKSISLNNAII
jgi:hypothetical protein